MNQSRNNILKWTISLSFILLLVVFFKQVAKKEHTLENGQLVFFELAPVDPRSLIQGDYMILNYAFTSELPYINSRQENQIPKNGYLVFQIDSLGVASKLRISPSLEKADSLDVYLKYHSNARNNFNLGIENFFFQEDHSSNYDKAKYAGVRVDQKGNAVLESLYDSLKNPL